MLADAVVMADQGGPMTRSQSDAKLEGYAAAYKNSGTCRWALETQDGAFLGYVGVMPIPETHVLGRHHDIGWRLVHSAWGQGYATEAARATLQDAFTRLGLTEVLAYTEPGNGRSRAVIARLGLTPDPSRDFSADYEGIGLWRGKVWVARP